MKTYILVQHDGYDYSCNLAASSDLVTLCQWKKYLDKQPSNSPIKSNGEYFVIEDVPCLSSEDVPSISGIRELLDLPGQE